MSDLQEVWAGIRGYNKYQVSNLGRVLNVDTGYMLTPKAVSPKNGQLRVALYINSIQKSFLVSRLVAQYFLPEFDEKKAIEYKDGDMTNLRVDNLKMSHKSANRKSHD